MPVETIVNDKKGIRKTSSPTKLRIAGVIGESIVDGPGIRYVVFAQGCGHHCPGCHNPQTHSFDGGNLMKIGDILQEIEKKPLLDGITFSGGEPFEQASAFAGLARRVKALHQDRNVFVYTGYTYEEILRYADIRPEWGELLDVADILIDGPFMQEKKSYQLLFRGSSNQRIIDMRQTGRSGRVVLAEV